MKPICVKRTEKKSQKKNLNKKEEEEEKLATNIMKLFPCQSFCKLM